MPMVRVSNGGTAGDISVSSIYYGATCAKDPWHTVENVEAKDKVVYVANATIAQTITVNITNSTLIEHYTSGRQQVYLYEVNSDGNITLTASGTGSGGCLIVAKP